MACVDPRGPHVDTRRVQAATDPPPITIRAIAPAEHDAIADVGENLLASIFGGPARPAAGASAKIAAGTLHPLLLGAEHDGALRAIARLEKTRGELWHLHASLAKGMQWGSPFAWAVLAPLWKRCVEECVALGLRAYVDQSRRDRAPRFGEPTFEDVHEEVEALRAAGLTADPPVRAIGHRIVSARTREPRVAPSADWETVAPENLPAAIRWPRLAEPGRHVAYRARPTGGIVVVSYDERATDPRLRGLGSVSLAHGPAVDAVDAARDALAWLAARGCSFASFHDDLAGRLIDADAPDLELDLDLRETVRWWTPSAPAR